MSILEESKREVKCRMKSDRDKLSRTENES